MNKIKQWLKWRIARYKVVKRGYKLIGTLLLSMKNDDYLLNRERFRALRMVSIINRYERGTANE